MRKFLNRVEIEGRLFDYEVHPMPRAGGFVGEGKIELPSWRKENKKENVPGQKYYEFPVRFFSNKSRDIENLPDGTYIRIKGFLTEDLRVNSSNPDVLRSKIYINIVKAEVLDAKDFEE